MLLQTESFSNNFLLITFETVIKKQNSGQKLLAMRGGTVKKAMFVQLISDNLKTNKETSSSVYGIKIEYKSKCYKIQKNVISCYLYSILFWCILFQ